MLNPMEPKTPYLTQRQQRIIYNLRLYGPAYGWSELARRTGIQVRDLQRISSQLIQMGKIDKLPPGSNRVVTIKLAEAGDD